MCVRGFYNFWFYGMKPASHCWQEQDTRQFEKVRFIAGVRSFRYFERKTDGVASAVHGNDFIFDGSLEAFKNY